MKVSLTPCKVREDRLVPIKGTEAICFSWEELTKKFAPSKTQQALRNLRYLSLGAYIGIKVDGTNLVFKNPDGSNTIAILIKQDPSFPSKIKEVWRVDSIEDRPSAFKESTV